MHSETVHVVGVVIVVVVEARVGGIGGVGRWRLATVTPASAGIPHSSVSTSLVLLSNPVHRIS